MKKFYIKKPVRIEAIQWTGTNLGEIDGFFTSPFGTNRGGYGFVSNDQTMFIDTLEGKMVASKGDYIIRGIKGEYYPCKPDIFELSYEECSSTDTEN